MSWFKRNWKWIVPGIVFGALIAGGIVEMIETYPDSPEQIAASKFGAPTPTPGPIVAVPPSRQIIAGAGLSGGGTLAADRTLSMPDVGPGAATYCGGSQFVTSTTLDAKGRVTGVVCASPGGVPANTLWFDYTRYALHDDSNCTGGYTQAYSAHATGTDQATSLFVTPSVNAHATGLHFYTSFATPVTATCTLYINAATPSSLASGTVSTTGRGLYQCVFSSSYAMTAGTPYYFAIYTPGNSTSLITCNSGGNPADYEGQQIGPSMILLTAGFCTGTAGGNNPPSICGSTKYPIAPEFTVP